MPHTTDDDDRRYRPREEVEQARQRDPILLLRSYLMETGLMTEEQDEEIRRQARAEVNQATDDADAAPYPDPSTVHDHVYAP
jgi:2-oxoisovalerate dehydrogenase E1 component alpha subunit